MRVGFGAPSGCPNLSFPCFFSVHAAVLAINQALEVGIVAETLAALRNPNAMLSGLREDLGVVYQEDLYQAKGEKARNAKNRVRRGGPGSARG